MRLTQAILARKKVALEAEEVVDQSVIDGQPTEGEVTDPVEETPVDEVPVTEEPIVDEVPVEEGVVEEPVVEESLATDEPGAGEIVPPDAEAVEEVIAPTTEEGVVTVDQVEAVASGEPEEVVADAVAEADTLAGEPTTPEEVIEETDEVNEELAAEPASEPSLPEEPLDIGTEDPGTEPVVDESPVEEGAVEETVQTPVEEVPVDDGAVVAETPEEIAEQTEMLVSTEDQTEEEPAPTEDTSPVSDPATEDCDCEDAITEEVIDVPEAPVDEFQEENCVYQEAIDTYPQVVEVLEASLDNGGISNEAMQLLNIFTKRDGIPVDNNVSLENFNHTARSQTRVALEAIKDDIVEWIKKFIANVVAHAKAGAQYLKNLFDVAEQTKKRLEAVKATVEASGSATGGKIKPFSSSKFIMKDNSADHYVANLEAVAALGQHIYSTLISEGVNLAGYAVDSFRTKLLAKIVNASPADSVEFALTTQQDIEASVTKFVDDKVRRVFPNVDNGYFSDVLLGGVTLGIDIEYLGETKKISEFKMVIVDKSSEGTPGEISALSSSEADQVIRGIGKLLAVVDNTKDDAAKAEKLVGEFAAELERLTKLSDNHQNGADQQTSSKITQVITSTLKIVTGLASGPTATTNKYLLRVGNAGLDYVEASFKGGEKPAEEPAAAEPTPAE